MLIDVDGCCRKLLDVIALFLLMKTSRIPKSLNEPTDSRPHQSSEKSRFLPFCRMNQLFDTWPAATLTTPATPNLSTARFKLGLFK